MPEPHSLNQYVCELYFVGSLELAAEKARQAAGQLVREGRAVRYLRTIGIPGDQLCLHLFEADSPDALDEVGRRAETPFDRVVEASEVVLPPSERRRP